MKITPQTIEELTEFTTRFDFSYLDIPAGIAVNTSQVWPLAGIPGVTPGIPAGAKNNPQMRAGDAVIQAWLHLITPFANTADAAFNSVTLSLGDQASATRFFNAVQVDLNGSFVVDTYFNPSNAFIYAAASLPQYLQLTLNSMAAKTLSNLNQGKLVIYLEIFRAGAAEKNIDLTQPAYVPAPVTG